MGLTSRPSLSSSGRFVVHERESSNDEPWSCKTGRRHAKLVPLSSHDEKRWPLATLQGRRLYLDPRIVNAENNFCAAIHWGYTCVSDLFAQPTRTNSPDVFVESKYKPGSATPEISTHPGASGIDVARLLRLGRHDGCDDGRDDGHGRRRRDRRRRDRCCRRRDVSLCKKVCLRATMDRARRGIVTRSGCLSFVV